jgi:hypothetical protein
MTWYIYCDNEGSRVHWHVYVPVLELHSVTCRKRAVAIHRINFYLTFNCVKSLFLSVFKDTLPTMCNFIRLFRVIGTIGRNFTWYISMLLLFQKRTSCSHFRKRLYLTVELNMQALWVIQERLIKLNKLRFFYMQIATKTCFRSFHLFLV